MTPLFNAATFLIKLIFNIYIIIILLHILIQWADADIFNPFAQIIRRTVRIPLNFLNRFIPKIKSIDSASVLYVILLEMIQIIAISTLIGYFPHIIGLIIWGTGNFLSHILNLYSYLILLNIILSWVAPMAKMPLGSFVYQLSEPILSPARRIIKPIGGLDFSPFLVLIALQLIALLFASPLINTGMRLAIVR